jgi:DNA-binding transcriptional MerR regulator
VTAAFALVRVQPAADGLDLDGFARAAGLHPNLVVRYISLGLLDPHADAAGRWSFTSTDVRLVARIQRLRAGFGLNYAAVGLVLDLLDRLAARSPSGREARPWTSTN